MKLIDEVAHRHGATTDRITDFYFGDSTDRFKVIETAHPVTISGGEVVTFRYDYRALVLRAVGWVEVAKLGQEHVDTALQAAQFAARVTTGREDS